jgi:hypothetical protein
LLKTSSKKRRETALLVSDNMGNSPYLIGMRLLEAHKWVE